MHRLVALGLLLLGCGPTGQGSSLEPVTRPNEPAALTEASAYMLTLINRDRQQHGLEPVEHDPVASIAAQRHADDMAMHGFTAHWGTDGSVPEQRYTEAGGEDFVQENAACLFDGLPRELDPSPRFDPALLEQLQKMFMDEVPPHDGHRRNILKPGHHRVGVGLSQPAAVNQPCLAQEFVDDWGDYSELPRDAPRNVTLKISGDVREPLQFGGVGLGRIDPPSPKAAKDLNETSVYRIPEPQTLYFPPGFKTPKPVKLEGLRFSIDIGLGQNPRAGRYLVSIWGKQPGSKELFMVSLRTIMVK
ncbi:MAG TPA: CAP domain-containing protein [Polyangiaceae bacterium]|nr:CAP domain-containing protein [Polyangiaceae bacterium]